MQMAETNSHEENPRLTAALGYARRGWPVFPCKPRTKQPLTKHGCKDATTDEATIWSWWGRWPAANVGIITGAPSDVIVLDLDKRPETGIDGDKTLQGLQKRYGQMPETVKQITGGGGSHLFFQHPGGHISNSVSKLGPGIDVKGDSGYVLAPPSVHPNGSTYEWVVSPDDMPPAPLPPAWVALLQSQPHGSGSQPRANTKSESIREGKRNDVLFRNGCFMRSKGMSHAAIEAALLAENAARCQPPLPVEEVKQTAASVTRYAVGSAPHLTRLSDVNARRVDWLWRGRIPLGKVTVVDGDPGLGKSLLSLDLASRVSPLRTMPDGTKGNLDGPAGVVLLSAEDDPADTIRPRLEAAGADVSRIVILSGLRDGDTLRLPTLADLEAIKQAITAVDAKLVIIDPLMAYLPGKIDSHRDQDIRRSLAPLAALAAETGVAVLVIRHLNKAEGKNALYRGGGSIGIIGAARSGLLVAKDPEDEDRRILAVTKANLAQTAPALVYRIAVTADETPYLSWEGATDYTANSLLATQADGEDRSTLDEAKEFLRGLLRSGAVPAKEVQKQADQACISFATLKRAKAVLKIIARKRGGFFSKNGEQQWCWMLPAAEGAQDTEHSTEGAHTHRDEHLQQDEKKNTRKSKDFTEDAQVIENEPLQHPEEAQDSQDERLQQSTQKDTVFFNHSPEDAQDSENEHLQGRGEHLQSWEEEL